MPRPVVISGSPEQQRPDERVTYRVILPEDSYPGAAAPISTLYDVTDGAETLSAANLTGSPAIGAATINGTVYPQVFTSPLMINAVVGKTYRLEFKFTSGGNTFEPYLMIFGVA